MSESLRISLPGGASFSAAPGENLLSAAQRAHWLVRYGCRNGNCEACAAKLLQGCATQRAETRSAPQTILLCLCTAQTDLQIELPGNPQHGSSEQARRCYAQLKTCNALSEGLWQLQFTLPAGRRPPVYPGQYLLIETDDGLLRADIDCALSQDRQLFANTSAALTAGLYRHIHYPLGYCYTVQRPQNLLLLADRDNSSRAENLRAMLGDTTIEIADGDTLPLREKNYSAVLACAADTTQAQQWFEALLSRAIVFNEFRCDEAIWRRWRVRRQDDNGNRFTVQEGLTEAAANTLALAMEARGHKQLYWAEPIF